MSSENRLDYLPYFTEGKVVEGFGRGGAELGIPTANFPADVIDQLPEEFVCGVYYGWACVNTLSPAVYKMVMCCGWNTHFQNTVKTMETHIMHQFDRQFYGENLRIIVAGYIRPMEAYNSLDALIQAVTGDINHADLILSQADMMELSQNPFLTKGTTTSAVMKAATVMPSSTCQNGDVSPSTSSPSQNDNMKCKCTRNSSNIAEAVPSDIPSCQSQSNKLANGNCSKQTHICCSDVPHQQDSLSSSIINT